jgi:hypothetical protein
MPEFVISAPPSQYGEMTLPVAEGTTEISEVLLAESESSDIPTGTVWYLGWRSLACQCGLAALASRDDEITSSTCARQSSR